MNAPFSSSTDEMDFAIALSAGARVTAGLTPNVGGGFWLSGWVGGEILSVEVELRGVLVNNA